MILNFNTLNSKVKLEKRIETYAKYIENKCFSDSVKLKEELKRYQGESLEKILNELTSVICYVSSLNKSVVMEDYSHVPTSIAKDLKTVHKKGELSIYLSIVMDTLLREVHKIYDCKFIQGFYYYTSDPQHTYSANLTSEGFHAFSVVQGKVIDCSFFTTESDYKSPCPAIIGKVPNDIRFYGWEESEEIEKRYVDEFSVKNHESPLEWLTTHLEGYQDYLIASI